MANIGDPVTQPIPTVGTTGTAYATQINAFLTEVKTRFEAKIPMASILIGTLDMTNNGITNAQYLKLQAQAASPTSPTGSLQNFGGDLFWISPIGPFQITVGGALNAAALAGITGDYGGANPAQFRFVDVDQEYYAYDDFAGGAWAYITALGMDIRGGATSAFRARTLYAGTVNYTTTLPPTLPGSQVLMQWTAAGQQTLSNTLPANTDIVLSGTGHIQQGSRTTTQGFNPIFTQAGAAAVLGALDGFPTSTVGVSEVHDVHITNLSAGDRVQTVKLIYKPLGTAMVPVLYLTTSDAGGGVPGVSSVTTSSATTVAGGFTTITLTVTTPTKLAANQTHFVKCTSGTVGATYNLITTTYDVPA